MPIDISELRRVLDYDAQTGIFRWRISPALRVKAGSIAGHITPRGRRMIRVQGRLYVAARLAWFHVTGEWPPKQIDHRNLVRDDDRFDNLRLATNSENQLNRHAPVTNTSGHKGVHWSTTAEKWQARVTINGVRANLGYFTDFAEAVAVYNAAAAKGHGDFFQSSS